MNINDWKAIQMRNDIKHIKRNVIGNNAANWSLVVDVFLVLLAFVLDRIFSDTETPNALWIIIAICGVGMPLILSVVEAIITKRTEQISRRVLNTKELVEMFDDEICYMIMSAEAFYKKLKTTDKIDSRQTALLLEFFVIEATYYLNKAVHLILKMDNNLSDILNQNDSTKKHISKERLINSISLIASIYEELFNLAESKNEDLKNCSIILDLSASKEKYKSLKDFASRKEKLIGIKIESTFTAQI